MRYKQKVLLKSKCPKPEMQNLIVVRETQNQRFKTDLMLTGSQILALLLEGKKGRRAQRGRRPNSANYHKLDSNLEEALTSSCNKNNSHIIY